VNKYVPLGSENVRDEPVLDWVELAKITDQLVPEGSPLSVKVTA
jgi:hypothetical protein